MRIAGLQSNQGVYLLLILLLAATLRLSLLGSKSLWFDEAYTVENASLAQEQIWIREPARIDSHPPLYYGALHYWERAAGISETAVRYPSALVSLLGVSLLFLLTRRLFGVSVALLAAALLAISPLDLWYAQEARMYIFMAVILLLAANLLLFQTWWALIPLTLTLAAGFYTDYTMLLLWIGLSAVWLAWWQRSGRSAVGLAVWALSTLFSLLLYAPWQATFLEWLGRFSEVTIYLRISEATGLPGLSAWSYIGLAIFGGLILIPLLILFFSFMERPDAVRWIIPAVLLAFVALSLLAVIPRYYSLKRILVQAWPALVVITAWLALQSNYRRRLAALLLAITLIAGLVNVIVIEKDDWRSAVAYVNARSAPGAVAMMEHPWNEKVTRYYELEPEVVRLAAFQSEPLVPGDVWFFVERFTGREHLIGTAETWLDAELELVETAPFFRVEVRRYAAAAEN